MRIFFFITIIIISTCSCGFKIVKQSDKIDFHISGIQTTGDQKINYMLKNILSFKTSDANKNKINLNIKTERNKSIKEKNSKNEITKYLLNIKLFITIKIEDKKLDSFSAMKEANFSVQSQYSKTINNEKQTTKILVEKLADEILKELSKRNFNDI